MDKDLAALVFSGLTRLSPSGEVLAKAQTEGDELILTTIDLDDIAKLKEKWDLLADRRPQEYQRLVR